LPDLDARVQARDEVARHYEVVIAATTHGKAQVALLQHQLVLREPQSQAHVARRVQIARNQSRRSELCATSYTRSALKFPI